RDARGRRTRRVPREPARDTTVDHLDTPRGSGTVLPVRPCGDLQGAPTAVTGRFPQGPRFGLPAAFPQTGQDSQKLLRRRRNMPKNEIDNMCRCSERATVAAANPDGRLHEQQKKSELHLTMRLRRI